MSKTGKGINNLFWAYEQTMAQLNVPLQNRKILVTYTKADLLTKQDQINRLKMPDAVEEYLRSDPYFSLGNRGAERPEILDVDAYSTNLERISEHLRDFTCDEVPGGSTFIAMSEDNGTETVFTINAAHPGGESGVQIERIRVIDPLLWTMILTDDQDKSVPTALILPNDLSASVYSDDWPVITHDILRTYRLSPSTFYMGQARVAYPTGNAPVDPAPSTIRPPLVGGILEQLPADSIAVVLIDNDLPLDINDFFDTSWEDRLLLIGSGDAVHRANVKWKYQAQSTSEIEHIIREFTQQIRQQKTNL